MANRIKTWVDLEVLTDEDLNAEFDNVYTGTIDRTAGRFGANDDIRVVWGSSQDAFIEWDTAQTNDCLMLGLSGAMTLLVIDSADAATDFALASRTNPAILVHSADATSVNEYIETQHNGTDAVINSGAGNLVLQIAGTTIGTLSSSTWDIQIEGVSAQPLVTATYYGTSANPALVGRRARGTSAAPTAVLTDDVIGAVGGRGYGATGFSSGNRAGINIIATQTWTDANQGAALNFLTTANNGTTQTVRGTMLHSGHLRLEELTTDPALADLTANAHVTVYNKNNKLVFAYNNAGTVTYLSIALDGSSTTWVHNTTAP